MLFPFVQVFCFVAFHTHVYLRFTFVSLSGGDLLLSYCEKLSFVYPLWGSSVHVSCDKIAFVVDLKEEIFFDMKKLLDDCDLLYKRDVDFPFDFYVEKSVMKYRHGVNNYVYNYNVTFDCYADRLNDESVFPSMYIGAGFCNYNRDDCKVKIELNPNKVFIKRCPFLSDLFNLLKVGAIDSNLKYYDIAFDLPFERGEFFLLKDQRKYSCVVNSVSDCTEYLGNRQNHGFVKLYNKTLESKLDYELTRLELSLSDFDVDSVVRVLPSVFHINHDFDCGSDKMLLYQLLLVNPDKVVGLSRKGRMNFGRWLEQEFNCFEIPSSAVEEFKRVLGLISSFVCLDEKYLEILS